MRSKIFIILLVTLIFSQTAWADTSAPSAGSEEILGFAKSLYDSGDYYRAITEYQRFIYLYPNDPKVQFARFQIGASYFAGDEFEDAIKIWQSLLERKLPDKLRHQTLYYLGAAHYKTGKYHLVRRYMEQLQGEAIDPALRADSQRMVIMSHIQQQEWAQAIDAAEKMSPPYNEVYAAQVKEGKNLPYKSPGTAGALSAILPGAGQLYAGQTQDAIMSFLLNGLFIWGAVESFSNDRPGAGVILVFFETGWYLGNIYSATNSAHKYNNELDKSFRQQVSNSLQFNLGVPQLTPLGLNISYKF